MMTKRDGLFLMATVMAMLVLAALSAPNVVYAQSDQAARVKIQHEDNLFGDVLLVRDNDDIILYGLAGAVPPLSRVTIEAGDQTFERNASFAGKFPLLSDVPIRIVGGAAIDSATVTAISGASAISGTVNLDLASPEILKSLSTYRILSEQGRSVEADIQGIPPHRLVNLVPETPADQPFVGKVLLTQRLIGSGNDAILVDQIEGLSGGLMNGVNQIRSVTPFSVIEVYTQPVEDLLNPDRLNRIETIQTEVFWEGEFRSNGSFFPFSVADVNSSNADTEPGTLYFRITSRRDIGSDGAPPKIFMASFGNDVVSAPAEGVVVNNNTQGAEGAPGADGIAVIRGTADPYTVLTAYRENSKASDVIAQATADGAGNYSMLIPAIFGDDGLYRQQTEIYVDTLDIFSNESDLVAFELDTESVIFEQPAATDLGDRFFQITGVAEPASIILITGRNRTGDVVFHAGDIFAAADGTFDATVPAAFEYTLEAIDQAGNSTTLPPITGVQNTMDPSNLTAVRAFPNIRVSGTVEINATGIEGLNTDVLVFAFPLNMVPGETAPEDAQPENSFYLTQARAQEDGTFTVLVPGTVSRVIYLQAIDNLGNESRFIPLELVDENGQPLTRGLVAFDNLSLVNNAPGVPDVLTGRTVDPVTGDPISGIFVNAFLRPTDDPEEVIPFVEPFEPFNVEVNEDGTFRLEIPEVSPVSETPIDAFYLVALEQQPDLSFIDVGFTRIDAATGFDREGPVIAFTPSTEDMQLIEYGCGEDDYLNIRNILPAGTGSANDLPDDALPIITVLAKPGNTSAEINVNDPEVVILDRKPLDAMMGVPIGLGVLPIPGVTGLRLGANCWDSSSFSVKGFSVVFVALIDAAGNLSPNPIPVFLDVDVDDPDPEKITAGGLGIFGTQEAVEPESIVTVYANPDKSGVIASTRATRSGAFGIGGLSIQQTSVYVAIRDKAGNESNAVQVRVPDPVEASQFLILDQLGLIHTSGSTLATGASALDNARALANVEGNHSLFYVLLADGTIIRVGESGQSPLESETVEVTGGFARDLVVTNANPFAGYMLLGNGVVLPFGGAPFFGDIAQLQRGLTDVNRLRLEDNPKVFYEDLNGNGQFDTEDANGNGVLDVSVGVGGQIIVNEDANGNGVLDFEPLVNPSNLTQGFETDIARELEVVTDSDGNVRGYVIMDGFGVMWPFGSDIGAENVSPSVTNGIAEQDIFRAFELIVSDEGQILDFITLNGVGQVFGFPGGLLGAGAATDSENAGHLTGTLDAPNFGFDIARDIRANPADSNGDGANDYMDGYYILDGFGGIHAIGGAPELDNAPFLGFDVARDLEFGSNVLR